MKKYVAVINGNGYTWCSNAVGCDRAFVIVHADSDERAFSHVMKSMEWDDYLSINGQTPECRPHHIRKMVNNVTIFEVSRQLPDTFNKKMQEAEVLWDLNEDKESREKDEKELARLQKKLGRIG